MLHQLEDKNETDRERNELRVELVKNIVDRLSELNYEEFISVKTLIDKRDVEASFGGHNIYLELVRNYGYMAGILLCVEYLFIGIAARKIFLIKRLNPLFMLLAATSISIMIVGGLTGTYPAIMNFSIANFTILGVAYALTLKNRQITSLIKIRKLKKLKQNNQL